GGPSAAFGEFRPAGQVPLDVCGATKRSSASNNACIEPEATPLTGEARASSAAPFSLPFSTPTAVKTAFAATGLGIFVVWAWHDGGFFPEEWLPGGLLLLALLCTAAAS